MDVLKSLSVPKMPTKEKTLAFLRSPLFISMCKGTLAYTLCFVLVFLTDFDKLFKFPVVATSTIIVTIAGFPGKSVGLCLASTMLAMFGVALGAFFFWVLAVIHSSIGQACVFFVIVYVMALIKAQGVQYFAFALLTILMSFNGIYTSTLVSGFSKDYLISYFTSYLWGGAIVLFVNIGVFPHTAEKELRMTLVASLDRIRTFGHLIAKTYRQEISPEEAKTRDMLNQSIRSDFTLLSAKLRETALELNWSKWSTADYNYLVGQTRMMQQTLISTYSSLMGVESKDLELFKTFLTGTRKDFGRLHKSIYLSLSEIQRELNVGPWKAGLEAEYYKDLERQQDTRTDAHGHAKSDTAETTLVVDSPEEQEDRDMADRRLREVQDRLQAEIDAASTDVTPRASLSEKPTPPHAGGGSEGERTTPGEEKESGMAAAEAHRSTAGLPSAMNLPQDDPSPCVVALRKEWERFRESQFERMGDVIAKGELHGQTNELAIDLPMPSIRDFWGDDRLPANGKERKIPGATLGGDLVGQVRTRKSARSSSRTPTANGESDKPTEANGEGDAEHEREMEEDSAIASHHSLVRVYSFMFSMNAFIDSLIHMHRFTRGDGLVAKKRKHRLHVHIFEGISFERLQKRQKRREQVLSEAADGHEGEPMSMREALAALENRTFVPEPVPWGERIARFETFFRSPESICAFKTACATLVIGVLFWVPSARKVFSVTYGVNLGVLTIVVALSPTLGQSLFTFILQIGGQGLGYIYGCIVCYIFRNVGGYRENPYGMVVLLAVGAFPVMYLLYSNPILFPFGLLFLNSAGVIVVLEYLNRHNPSYDSPAVRLGKGLVVLVIGLTLVSIFQLMILRNPARRTLRKACANISAELTAYGLILQAYVRALAPADGKRTVSQSAVDRVWQDLKKREIRIQGQLIGIMPLLKFSGVEPSLVKGFDPKQWVRVIRSCQIILDRFRDARVALGTAPLDDRVMTHYVQRLAPYRRRANRFVRGSMYATTSALKAKLALPSELPSTSSYLPAFVHDLLVLSSRLAKEPGGLEIVKGPEVVRYMVYLLGVTSAGLQLDELAAAIRVLFGVMEDDVPMRYGTKED